MHCFVELVRSRPWRLGDILVLWQQICGAIRSPADLHDYDRLRRRSAILPDVSVPEAGR